MQKAMLAVVAAIGLAACEPDTPAAAPAPAPDAGGGADPVVGDCPDDGPRFAGTGICKGRASPYMNPDMGPPPDLTVLPNAVGCQWVVNEALIADGSQAVLYNAVQCGDVVSEVEYAGGARSAELQLKTSALGERAGTTLVRIFVSDPADPTAVIRSLIVSPPGAAEKCEVRNVGAIGSTTNAYRIVFKPEFQLELPPRDGPLPCGEFGPFAPTEGFWRLHGGYAWYFTVPATAPDIDPGSLSLIRKDGGAWGAVE